MNDHLRFAEYMTQAMIADNWQGERPALGDTNWWDKVRPYIDWLRFEKMVPLE